MQTLQQGSKIGEYSVEALVSSGAAGALYRATQPNLNRTVAVQVASAPAESEQGERFLNAARRLAAIDHPNLLPVYEVGVDEARPFAVMRDVRGQPLDELLRAAPLAAKPAVAVADGVAGALDALRSSGVAVARLDAASVVVAPDHVYFAPLIAGTELRRLEDAGPDPSVPALAALVDSMVDATGNDRLARVIHTGRQGGYPSAASLVEAARNAVAPAPRRRRRGALLLAAAGLAAALVLAVALVTADDEERPQEVNRPLATAPAGRIAARIALNADPGSAAVGEGAVWVATQEGNVLRVDPRRNEVTGAPIRFMRARRGENVTVRVGAGAVFALDGSGGRLTRIDPRTGRVTGRLRLGGTLDGATIAEGSVWVTRTDSRGLGSLVRVDPRTLRAISRTRTGGAGAAPDVEVAAGAAWVMNAGTGTVIRLDLRNGGRREFRVNSLPLGAAVRGDTIWIPDPFGGTVTPLNVRDPQLPETVARPGAPFAVVATEDAIWVAANTEPGRPDAPTRLYRVDPRTSRPAGRPVETGRGTRWPTAGLGAIWVPDSGSRRLVKVVPTSPPPAPAPAVREGPSPRVLRSGPLPPGEWRVRGVRPPLALRVGERGWVTTRVEDGFELARFDDPRFEDPDGSSFLGFPVRQAFRSDGGVRPVRRAADLVDAVRSNRNLRVLSRRRTTLGGLAAAQLVIRVRRQQRGLERCETPCVPVLALKQGTFVIEAPTTRLSVIEHDGRVLALLEEAGAEADFSRTQAILRTLRFGVAP